MQNGPRCRPFLPTLSWSVVTTQTFLVVVIQVIALYLFFGRNQCQEYVAGENIPLWLDSVGPVNNPHERYPFTSLPYCYPGLSTVAKEESEHNDCRSMPSGHNIGFLKNSTYECTTHPLSYEDLMAYYKLIRGGSRHQNSTFRMYLANIPLYGMIGSEYHYTEETGLSENFVYAQSSKVSFLLYTRHNLIINADRRRILNAYLESDTSSLVELKENKTFTHELVVQYHHIDDTKRAKTSRFRSTRLLDEEWKYSGLSLFVFVALIWFSPRRTSIWARVRKLQTNQISPRLGKDQDKEISTKSGPVNEPQHLSILAAMTGAGCQLFFVATVIGYKTWIHGSGFILRGEVIDTFWTSAALTSFIGSYTLTRIVRVHREPNMLGLYDDGMNLFQRELKLDVSDVPAVDTDECINKAVVLSNKKHLLYGIIKESLCIYWCILNGFHMTIQLLLSTVDWWHGKMEITTCSQTRSLSLVIYSIGPQAALAIAIGVVGSLAGLKGRIETTSKLQGWQQLHPPLDKFGLLQGTLNSVVVSGFLAFVSLSFEFHALMSSTWYFHPYEVTPSTFFVITLSTFIMTVGTRISLSVRFASGRFDWQWLALGCGMSMYLYFIASAYFYFLSSWMTGWYQRLNYWLIIFCIGLDVGLIYGAISFWSAYSFATFSPRQKKY